jgi:hypothetical protein
VRPDTRTLPKGTHPQGQPSRFTEPQRRPYNKPRRGGEQPPWWFALIVLGVSVTRFSRRWAK